MVRNVSRATVAATIALLAIASIDQTSAGDGETVTRQVCRAGIALLMGRDPEIVKIESFEDGIIYLH